MQLLRENECRKAAIICGTRQHLGESKFHKVQAVAKTFDVVITGCAKGVDSAARFSNPNEACEVFNADWDNLGKAAGPIRNRQMAERLDEYRRHGYTVVVVAFPGGIGTTSMKREAKKLNLPVLEMTWD